MGGGCTRCGKSSSTNAGNTANTAIVFGTLDNEVRRVKFAQDVGGIRQGAIKYVRGEGVQALLDSGALVQLAGGARPVNPMKRGATLYYVGAVGYTDIGSARVRSGQTGEEIVIKTIGE